MRLVYRKKEIHATDEPMTIDDAVEKRARSSFETERVFVFERGEKLELIEQRLQLFVGARLGPSKVSLQCGTSARASCMNSR